MTEAGPSWATSSACRWRNNDVRFRFRRALFAEPVENLDVRLRGSFHAPLLFGAVTHDRERKVWFNSALLLDRQGQLSAPYDKIFLLVFAEYIPLADTFPALEDLFPDMAPFARGRGPTTFSLPDARAPGGAWRPSHGRGDPGARGFRRDVGEPPL